MPLAVRRTLLRAVPILAALLCVVLPAEAQRLRVSASADSVLVGERFTLSILADHGIMPEGEPIFPDVSEAPVELGDIVLLAVRDTASRYLGADEPGVHRDSIAYEAAVFTVDTARVAAIPVGFPRGADTLRATTQPFLLPVISVVPPDAEGIRDLAPLAEFPRSLWPWLLALAVALALAALAYYGWKRRQAQAPEQVAVAPPLPPVSPYREAVERLNRLENTDLLTPEHVKPFYVELSDTLRTYLAQRLGVHALEETTSELVRELRRIAGRQPISEDVIGEVRAVLELADIAKFADAKPPAERGRDALGRTRATLDHVEDALRPRIEIPTRPVPADVPA